MKNINKKNVLTKLNLGCGNDYMKGWTNLDILDVKTDVSHNLNKFPWPFKNNTFNEILMKSVLEHVDDPIKTLKEAARVGKNGAKITVIVPHANCYAAVTDIQHKTFFTENSFENNLLIEYGLNKLKLIRKELLFRHKWKEHILFRKQLKIFINGLFEDLLFEFEVNK